jgi:hypothetical protein
MLRDWLLSGHGAMLYNIHKSSDSTRLSPLQIPFLITAQISLPREPITEVNQREIVFTQRKEAPALRMLSTRLHDGAADSCVLPGPKQPTSDQPG